MAKLSLPASKRVSRLSAEAVAPAEPAASIVPELPPFSPRSATTTEGVPMDKFIVYVDDLAYAQQHLAPMVATRGGPDAPAGLWVVVACAPRMTHRISKWVSHSARENWRAKWADRFFGELLPWLTAQGDTAQPVLAKGPLAPLTASLRREHPSARVLDLRRPKFGQDLQPVSDAQPQPEPANRWAVPGAVAGLGALLVLAAE